MQDASGQSIVIEYVGGRLNVHDTPLGGGTEIGGSVKNVIALANGMAVGMGFGENAQSSLITRGLAEMTRLGLPVPDLDPT